MFVFLGGLFFHAASKHSYISHIRYKEDEFRQPRQGSLGGSREQLTIYTVMASELAIAITIAIAITEHSLSVQFSTSVTYVRTYVRVYTHTHT